jgi:hypothetical protein
LDRKRVERDYRGPYIPFRLARSTQCSFENTATGEWVFQEGASLTMTTYIDKHLVANICDALVRNGLAEKRIRSDGEPEFSATRWSLKLERGNPQLHKQLLMRIRDVPEEFQKFLVANKTELNRYRD